jgi:hypothetical protein
MPGFDDIYPAAGNPLTYANIMTIYHALNERAFAIGQASFPRSCFHWSGGKIAAVTATTLQLESQPGEAPVSWVTDRWIDNDGVAYYPSDYDVVIYRRFESDPSDLIRAQISSNTSDTLTISDIRDNVAFGIVEDLSELVGWDATIIKRNGDFYLTRWPEWPGPSIKGNGSVTSGTTSTLTDTAQTWTTDQFEDMDVLVVGTDGFWHRAQIISNTATVLTFDIMSWTPNVGASFVVVEHLKKWRPNIVSGGEASTQIWYRGTRNNVSTHVPLEGDLLGEIGSLPLYPRDTTTILTGESCDEEEVVTIFDRDPWIEFDDQCNTPNDEPLNPNVAKSLRFCQTWMDIFAGTFYENKDHSGYEHIIHLSTAILLKNSLAHYVVTSVDYVSSTEINVGSVTAPFYPHPCWYEIRNATTNELLADGAATLTSATVLQSSDFEPTDDGHQITISLGRTRRIPREFRYMYEKTGFLPDFSGPSIVIPPTDTDPGSWTTRAASNAYAEFNDHGTITDTVALVNGDFARYRGDNHGDPTLGDETPTDDIEYRDAFFTGYRLTPSGIATEGDIWFFRDSSLNLFGGVLRTETGTATGGSTTSLSDSTKAGTGLWNTATGRWNNFIVEVETSAGVWERRPVLTTTYGSGTLTWTKALSTTANGKAYRIYEPAHILNDWKNRTLRITEDDGTTTHDVTITHNDNDTFYYADQAFTVDVGWTCEVLERQPGTTWERSSGSWIEPTGEFSGENQTKIPPTIVTRYGWVMNGDYFGEHVMDEIVQSLKELVKTSGGAFYYEDWPDCPDPNIYPPEEPTHSTPDNHGVGTAREPITDTSGGCDPHTDADAMAEATTNFLAGQSHVIFADGPYAFNKKAHANHTCSGPAALYEMQRRMKHAKIAYGSGDRRKKVSFEAYLKTAPYGTGPNDEFDGQGDPVLGDNKWSLFTTSAPDDSFFERLVGEIGSLGACPNWPDYPAGGEEAVFGWISAGEDSLIRWDVAGGFDYY